LTARFYLANASNEEKLQRSRFGIGGISALLSKAIGGTCSS